MFIHTEQKPLVIHNISHNVTWITTLLSNLFSEKDFEYINLPDDRPCFSTLKVKTSHARGPRETVYEHNGALG